MGVGNCAEGGAGVGRAWLLRRPRLAWGGGWGTMRSWLAAEGFMSLNVGWALFPLIPLLSL